MYSSLLAGSRSWQSASLPGQGHALQGALADDEVAGLAGGLAGPRRRQALLDDPPPVAGVLVEVLGDPLGHGRLHLSLDLGVAELGLRLALELGLDQLDRHDRGEALADVVAREVRVVVLEHAGAPGPVVDGGREGGPEAGDVRPAVDAC